MGITRMAGPGRKMSAMPNKSTVAPMTPIITFLAFFMDMNTKRFITDSL
jgi:hypothetical protein